MKCTGPGQEEAGTCRATVRVREEAGADPVEPYGAHGAVQRTFSDR